MATVGTKPTRTTSCLGYTNYTRVALQEVETYLRAKYRYPQISQHWRGNPTRLKELVVSPQEPIKRFRLSETNSLPELLPKAIVIAFRS